MDIQGIYKIIAEENHITVEEVRDAIQETLRLAWTNPNKTLEQAATQKEVPCKGDIPTPEEYLMYAKSKLS